MALKSCLFVIIIIIIITDDLDLDLTSQGRQWLPLTVHHVLLADNDNYNVSHSNVTLFQVYPPKIDRFS